MNIHSLFHRISSKRRLVRLPFCFSLTSITLFQSIASSRERETTHKEVNGVALKQLLARIEGDPTAGKRECIDSIEKLCKSGNLADAFYLFRELRDRQLCLNLDTYNLFLTSAGESNQWQNKKALLIFEDMKNAKCKPDQITYNTVIAILGKMGKIDGMLQEFSSMKESGHLPDIITYNTLINSFRQMGRLDLCINLMREMVRNGIEPDLRSYTAMIDCLGRVGQVDEALELFSEMTNKRQKPSVYIYRSLISNLKKAGKWELAKRLSEEHRSCSANLIGPSDFKRKKR
ncbi:pentatricopeptide repeat-containing protein At1g11900 isoform X2 [Amborella trichopoda]|uniref:pentatricopeptide repeat-containing protein At1g11900 isoform X2 n=1 Tax=Amborella trichopoda TaxID=13333 RepID=UPI0009BD3D36|nr:pentatricopeptide repeat-containing protein At1g11900 isoform X2 [Amborella trichopoda]|eukprot:XP_020521843.1 pentatricopeptide repeat-containing protein At1g11900 isoform X2 [Amborella trichopoda]